MKAPEARAAREAQVAPSDKPISELDILDAKDLLDFARAQGDKLKIALYEASLNDLLDRYSCHGCHESQPERVNA